MENIEFMYMAISDDEYELPIAIARTQKELSQMTGTDIAHICRELKLQQKNIWSRFIKVPVEGAFSLPSRETKPTSRKNKAIVGNGKTYSSQVEAAKEHNVSVATINYWLKVKTEWEYCE